MVVDVGSETVCYHFEPQGCDDHHGNAANILLFDNKASAILHVHDSRRPEGWQPLVGKAGSKVHLQAV